MAYRILYIEDEAILGQLVQEALEKDGYEVARFTNGAAGIQDWHRQLPHLLLLDVMLPDADGYQLAAQLRSLDKAVPIIFLTAKVQVQDLVRGFDAGCNDYIRKPFSMDELLLRTRRWIEERYAAHALPEDAGWPLGRCVFYPGRQLLETRNGTYRLTHKEAEVLRLLYRQQHAVTGRAWLLQQVWGSESGYTSRILDVYITRLRKYFRGSANEIITLKGIGYRFVIGPESDVQG